jgi:hypothetical protein
MSGAIGSIVGGLAGGPVGAAIGGAIGGALDGQDASQNAADAQRYAADQSSGTQLSMFNQNRQDYAPWRQAGVNALARLTAGTAPGGEYSRSFTMNDYQQDPGYNFRLTEGLKAINNSAAARGLLQSGANLKGLNRYAQDYASGEYTNAFNRFQLDQSNRFNRNAALAGIGQTAQQQLAQQGANTAAQIGQNQLAAGNAQAAGYIGGANALSGAIGQGMNFYNQNRLLDQLQRGGGYGSGGYGGGGYNFDYNGYAPFGGSYTYGTSSGE